MSDARAAIATLRRLADVLPTLGVDGAWMAEQLRRYFNEAPTGGTLDEALGVAPQRGEWPWWRREQRERERVAARRLVQAFGDPRTALQVLRRYADGRGRHASEKQQYHDDRTQAAHDYLHAAGKVPATPRTLSRALADDDI